MPNPVVIVGAGLAGLTCARHLSREGRDVISEASDDIGGRVRTEELDGFLLDRGFEVLLTACPEAQRLLDYEDLNVKPFDSGSLIRTSQGLQRLSDPWRYPGQIFETAFADVGSLADKLQIAALR